MPEHLRALVVILVIAAAVFYMARPIALQVVSTETFSRWRTAWFGLTLVLFLSHSFWIYALLLVFWLRYLASRESNVIGLYFLLLFVAPPSAVELPGFGVVDHLLVLNQYRLVSLALLLPVALRLLQTRNSPRWGSYSPDWFVFAYVLLISVMELRDANITSFARQALTNLIDILLPYYAISRSLRDIDTVKGALLGFVFAACLLSIFALFEVARYWKLYVGVLSAIGLNPMEFGGYLERAGMLRPNVTLGNSIVLGYVIMVGMAYALVIRDAVRPGVHLWMGISLLFIGVFASLSRGPWVGLVVLWLVFAITDDYRIKRMMQTIVGGGLVVVIALQFELGRALIDMLPVFGEVDAGNVEYRADLLMQAIPVIERNFWFGSTDYLEAPELQIMRQGEGIIDIVNTYVAVLLEYGVVGLALFLGVFLSAAYRTMRGIGRAKAINQPHLVLVGRALLAAVVAVATVIYTVSSITAIPIVYWSLVGICSGYQGLVRLSDISDARSRKAI